MLHNITNEKLQEKCKLLSEVVMALGQYVAGMGFGNVGLGLVHGMTHPLGSLRKKI